MLLFENLQLAQLLLDPYLTGGEVLTKRECLTRRLRSVGPVIWTDVVDQNNMMNVRAQAPHREVRFLRQLLTRSDDLMEPYCVHLELRFDEGFIFTMSFPWPVPVQVRTVDVHTRWFTRRYQIPVNETVFLKPWFIVDSTDKEMQGHIIHRCSALRNSDFCNIPTTSVSLEVHRTISTPYNLPLGLEQLDVADGNAAFHKDVVYPKLVKLKWRTNVPVPEHWLSIIEDLEITTSLLPPCEKLPCVRSLKLSVDVSYTSINAWPARLKSLTVVAKPTHPMSISNLPPLKYLIATGNVSIESDNFIDHMRTDYCHIKISHLKIGTLNDCSFRRAVDYPSTLRALRCTDGFPWSLVGSLRGVNYDCQHVEESDTFEYLDCWTTENLSPILRVLSCYQVKQNWTWPSTLQMVHVYGDIDQAIRGKLKMVPSGCRVYLSKARITEFPTWLCVNTSKGIVI